MSIRIFTVNDPAWICNASAPSRQGSVGIIWKTPAPWRERRPAGGRFLTSGMLMHTAFTAPSTKGIVHRAITIEQIR